MTHEFLEGMKRGIYSNDSITINVNCFGLNFVKRINQFTAMYQSDIWANLYLEMAVIYQLYYMVSDICKLDETFNDFYIYCWNVGCQPSDMLVNTEMNFLYMFRSLIDAAIVWYEGVPPDINTNFKQWVQLSRQTGETFAQIIK